MNRETSAISDVIRESCEDVARRMGDVLLRALFDYTKAYIYAKDLAGRYIFVNQHFLDVFAIREEDIIGRTLFDVYPEEEARRIDREQAPVRNGEVVEIMRTKLIGGTEYAYSLVMFPLLSRDGEIVGYGGIGRDITDQRRSELRLIEAMRASLAVRRSAEIGHDLNNIIFGITGNAVLALEDAADTKLVREDIERILKATEEAADFVKSMFPRERQRLALEVLSPAACLRGVAGLLRRTFPVRIEIRESYAADVPEVRLDRDKLEQAIVDLCIHAKECMPASGEIALSADRMEAPSWAASDSPGGASGAASGCLIGVRCEGIDLRSLDPRHTAAHASAMGHAPGVPGVGVLKGLVRELGGSLRHEHAPARVSCEIFLPGSARRPDVEACGPEELSLAGTAVYVVSEDAGIACELESALAGAEYEVVCCRSASDALRNVHEGSIGAVIVDQRLAGMSPLALVKAMSGLQGHAAMLLATLADDAESLQPFLAAGAAKVITKPLSREIVRASVAEVLRDLLRGAHPA